MARRSTLLPFWGLVASALAIVVAAFLPDPMSSYVLVSGTLLLCVSMFLIFIHVASNKAAWERFWEQNLVLCDECGKRISKKAAQCPNCGAQVTHGDPDTLT